MLLFGNFSIYALIAAGIVLLFGMGIHEYAHAAMADYWGDPTPRQMGRLTPNPLVHISWIGWAMFLIIGFGILGSVPITPSRMRDPKWGSFWTSFAGPLSNLLQAVAFGILIRVFGAFSPVDGLRGMRLLYGQTELGVGLSSGGFMWDFISLLFAVGILFNVLLFVFNLLPFYPIDGWRMMLAILPGYGLTRNQIPEFIRAGMPPVAAFLERPAYKWQDWAQISQYVLLALIFIPFMIPQLNLLGWLIGEPVGRLTFALAGI